MSVRLKSFFHSNKCFLTEHFYTLLIHIMQGFIMTDSRFARALLGILFVGMGVLKWVNFEGTVGYFESLYFPLATFFTVCAIAILILGGLGLIFRVGAYISSLLLTAYMVVVLVVAHNIFTDFAGQIENFLKALGILAALVFVAKTQRELLFERMRKAGIKLPGEKSGTDSQEKKPKLRGEDGFTTTVLEDAVVYTKPSVSTNESTSNRATTKKASKSARKPVKKPVKKATTKSAKSRK